MIAKFLTIVLLCVFSSCSADEKPAPPEKGAPTGNKNVLIVYLSRTKNTKHQPGLKLSAQDTLNICKTGWENN